MLSKTKKYFSVILILEVVMIPNVISACRLWGIVELSNTSITNNVNSYHIIQSESNFFQSLGSNYISGWSLSSYSNNGQLSGIYRSELLADMDSMYQVVFDSLSYLPDTTTKLIGHLRVASSGANDIANPHPFIYNFNIWKSLLGCKIPSWIND